jgi:predicted transcriptional regulator
MAEESTTPRLDTGLLAAIVSSYVTKNSVGVDQLGDLIATVHRALSGLGTNPPRLGAEALTPAVPIRRSVQHDHVVCLECGFRAQTLRRHLRVRHDLDAARYRARWKLSPDHLVTAPGYSERRATMAKQIGLGRKAEVPPPIPEVVAAAAPSPKRRGRKPRSAAAE